MVNSDVGERSMYVEFWQQKDFCAGGSTLYSCVLGTLSLDLAINYESYQQYFAYKELGRVWSRISFTIRRWLITSMATAGAMYSSRRFAPNLAITFVIPVMT